MAKQFRTTLGRTGVVRWLLLWILMVGSAMSPHAAPAQPPTPATLQLVPFTDVKVDDVFWAPRIETNRKVTVPYDFKKCEETGRIDNFAKAGGLMKGEFRGIPFDDSDVYKVIEGASYCLATQPDPQLDKYLDDLIAKIAAAQEGDGYLYTARRLFPPDKMPAMSGKERWVNLRSSHELYNVGHLYEAAAGHFQATGKRSLLNVALKNADFLCTVFAPDKLRYVPGHQEIEIGLVKLYKVTGDAKYLRLAKFFLDERGKPDGHNLYGDYAQDHIPVVDQTKPVGHAVRAGYMYCGMVDVGTLTGQRAYLDAVDSIWQNIVSNQIFITGSVGPRGGGEAFGDAYELPNATAYNETCAAIANALLNFRLFLVHGDGKYMDVLERAIYNGFLSGIALSGDRFFYPNPLEFDGQRKFNHGSAERQPWFGCSCCPVNIVRFIPQIPGWQYAVGDGAIYVNLFIGGAARVKLGDNAIKIVQKTRYPWDGQVRLSIEPEKAGEFDVLVRIPGWATGSPLPSDLYRYLDKSDEKATLAVNGLPVAIKTDKGFARIHRTWKAGDVIELRLPMPVRRVAAHEAVKADEGRVALMRGPVTYCAEAVDNGGHVLNLVLPDDVQLASEHHSDLLGGVTVIRGQALAAGRGEDKSVRTTPAALAAVPYYAWSHRGIGEMAVWLPRTADKAKVAPAPTIAGASKVTASHLWELDTLAALNDQIEPKSSGDHDVPRFTWWDHRGTTEWVQYDFAKPRKVSAVEVYWFDDTGRGSCRTPRSWKMFYKDGETWKPVEAPNEYGVEINKYNRAAFKPVETSALRIEAQLKPKFSGGILEWRVLE